MQIVINIPKIAYDLLKSDETIDWLDAENILNSIVEGVVLPKGHGDLVDRNDLKYEKYNSYAYAIANAPIIVEADKAEKENK